MTYLKKKRIIAIILLVVILVSSSFSVFAQTETLATDTYDNFIVVIWNKIMDFFKGLGDGEESPIKEKEITSSIPRLNEDGILLASDKKIKDDKFTGQGKYIELDGSTYEGDFVDNSKQGNGKIVSQEGKTLYEGNWENDEMSGQGKLQLDDNSYFEGTIENSQPVNGKYVVKESGGEVVSEIKDGFSEVKDLSNNQDLKNQLKNLIDNTFSWTGIPLNSTFTETDILSSFAFVDNLHNIDRYRYPAADDGTFTMHRVPEEEVNKYSEKVFGRKLNGASNTNKYVDEFGFWTHYYKDNYYYFGYPDMGWEGTTVKVRNVYELEANKAIAIVDSFIEGWADEPDQYSQTLSIELEKIRERYVLKGATKVNKNHTINQGQKLNITNAPITTPDQKPQKKKEFLTQKPNIDLFFKNINETYGKIDQGDKTNNKVLDTIANDVDRHIEGLFTNIINTDSQQIILTKRYLGNHLELIDKYKESINQYTDGINKSLTSAGIKLRRQPLKSILINLDDYAYKDNFSFYIGSDMKEYLSNIDKAVFNISGQRISFDAKSLEEELENGDLIIEISNDNGIYNIIFKDANGLVKDSVKAKVSLSIPLQGKRDNETVYYTSSNNNTGNNIGGKYDKATKTIEVQTKSSGKFEIKENVKSNFSDLDKQDKETKEAIANLVAKGIMEAKSEDEFRPDQTMTREEFAMAMVKLFYELDYSTKSTFTDVGQEDDYYVYIASSEKENIVKGYPDKTFKGEDPITREDVISIASRGLHEKKKYVYPDNPEDLLKFKDKDKILNYAKKEVALSVREGIIENTKKRFEPQGTMTRAQAAVIINRLINKLY